MMHSDVSQVDWNTSYWRILLPAQALKKAGHEVKIRHISAPIEGAEIVIFEREAVGPNVNRLAAAKRSGMKVYLTFDDCYEHLPPNSLASSFWHKQALADFRKAVGLVDGSLVASKKLQEYYSKFGEMFLVENYLPESWYPEIVAGEYDLGWSGSSEHERGWRNSGLPEALKKTSKTLLLNTQSSPIINMLAYRYQKHVHWVHQSKYMDVVKQFRIGLAPLNGEYDQYRSTIKLLGYAAAGRPWVATRASPYLEAQGGVLVDNTPKGWLAGIDEVESKYAELAEKGLTWARSYSIENNLSRYLR